MSKVLDEVLTANAEYVKDFGDKGDLPALDSKFIACRFFE